MVVSKVLIASKNLKMNFFITLLFFVTTCSGNRKIKEYRRTPLGDSVDKASFNIFKETFQSANDKNVIASPLGTLTLLSMISAGTEGKSREEILKLLGSTDYKLIEESYGSLTERFSLMDPSYLVLANKMYLSDQYTLNDEFSNVTRQSYKSEVEQVDFYQKKATADIINKWAGEKTKGHINSPIEEDTIDEDSAIALFNIIFFQGHWHVPFDVNNTEEKDFYVDESQTVQKPMMKLLSSLYYHENSNIGARMVELPYKENGFRMVVVLPDKKDGLSDVVEKLSQEGILQDVFALRPAGRKVDFEMPKFEIKNSLDLNNILPKVGVSGIFTEGVRGVVRERVIVVSKSFQKAFVKVDEEGATAGAFTGIIGSALSSRNVPPPPLPFKVDHPFLFVILHEDIVLFTGTYAH